MSSDKPISTHTDSEMSKDIVRKDQSRQNDDHSLSSVSHPHKEKQHSSPRQSSQPGEGSERIASKGEGEQDRQPGDHSRSEVEGAKRASASGQSGQKEQQNQQQHQAMTATKAPAGSVIGPRISALTQSDLKGDTLKLYEGFKSKSGKVANFQATLANSPAALQGFHGLNAGVKSGSFSDKQREMIALTIGEQNNCDYCLSAHSESSRAEGLNDKQILDARRGRATDPKTSAILALARTINDNRGVVDDTALQAARSAGLSDSDLMETVANVSLNILTNYTNQLAGTSLDFPKASALS